MYNSFKLLLRSYVQRRETNPLISFVVVQRRPRLRGSAEAKWMQNGGEEEEEGRVEKRRATVFELKVERKWRRGWEATRDSSYEEETATVDYRRFENLWTRSSLFPSLSLFYWVRRIRPNARKKRNLHERTWALHCIA